MNLIEPPRPLQRAERHQEDSMKRYWIYYRGTGYGMYIEATGPKKALELFATHEQKPVSAYMAWKRA